MKIYSHRGNLEGPRPKQENEPRYIEKAIESGFIAEVDIWKIGERWYLGHDVPQYHILQDWVLTYGPGILFHAKNSTALFSLFHLSNFQLEYFWHESDRFTMTSNGKIITYPGEEFCEDCIIHTNNPDEISPIVSGLLTDFPIMMKELL